MRTTFVTLSAFLILASTVRAESRADLERDVARLRQEVAAKQAAVDALSQPWLNPHAIDVSFSAAPLISLIRGINTFSAAERRIDFAVYAANGQLWGWDADCVFLGHTYSNEGAYIEFKDPNYRVEANLQMSNFDAAWAPGQGLRLGLDGVGHLGIGMLHWHRKPCVGGGVGGDAGPATFDASAHLAALATFTFGTDNVLRYAADINANNVHFSGAISFGSLGDFPVQNLVQLPVSAHFNGAMPVPVTTTGTIASHDPRLPISRTYDIRLTSPALQATADGVDVGTDVQIVWR